MAAQKKKKKAPATKKAPAKKDQTQNQEAQSVEKKEAPAQEEPQEEQNVGEETKKAGKTERVITILSAEDSHFLSQFEISRSALTRAVLRGAREFLEREEFKTASEVEIVERLRFLLK